MLHTSWKFFQCLHLEIILLAGPNHYIFIVVRSTSARWERERYTHTKGGRLSKEKRTRCKFSCLHMEWPYVVSCQCNGHPSEVKLWVAKVSNTKNKDCLENYNHSCHLSQCFSRRRRVKLVNRVRLVNTIVIATIHVFCVIVINNYSGWWVIPTPHI
jgi:hypothetical protein